MTTWRDPKDTPYPGPHNADGRYIYGPALKSLGRAFDTEDQPIETVCATARLWAAAWELLEVCKAQDAVEARIRTMNEVDRNSTTAQRAEAEAIGAEVRRIKEMRAAAIAKATGDT